MNYGTLVGHLTAWLVLIGWYIRSFTWVAVAWWVVTLPCILYGVAPCRSNLVEQRHWNEWPSVSDVLGWWWFFLLLEARFLSTVLWLSRWQNLSDHRPHVATRGPATDSERSMWLQRGDEVPPKADGDYRRPLISPTERRGRRQSLLPRVESRSNSLTPPLARPGGPRVQITSSAVWAARSHLFPQQIDGETEGKINGFLSRRSQLCRVWEFDVTPLFLLSSLPLRPPHTSSAAGKLKAGVWTSRQTWTDWSLSSQYGGRFQSASSPCEVISSSLSKRHCWERPAKDQTPLASASSRWPENRVTSSAWRRPFLQSAEVPSLGSHRCAEGCRLELRNYHP